MKIKSLKANGVYGFLKIDINFNNDISFITGFNGSGKTTSIRLLNAILTPSAKDLNLIPFSNLSVTITHDKKTYTINATTLGNQIEIKIPDHFKEKAIIPIYETDEIEYRYEEKERGDDFFNSIILKQRDNKIINFLLDIPSPIFLGLERKIITDEPFESRFNRRRYIGGPSISLSHVQKIMRSNLGYGILEVQQLLQEKISSIRHNIDLINQQQKNELIKNSFKYTKVTEVFDNNLKLPEQESKLLERRQEIESALESMGMLDKELKNTLEDFFKEISSLQEKKMQRNNDKNYFDIEWLINSAQIKRINEFINIIDVSKVKIDAAYAPINSFQTIVNSYFQESGKKIEVDPIGQLSLKRPDNKSISIEGLSSGEKQILIIFANSILRTRKDAIFIIDEPELSLHIGWQEKFIEDIQSIQSDSQYIFATHSPEIIAGFEDKCLGVIK